MFYIVFCLLLYVYGLPIVTADLEYTCYPNSTFIVINPNATIYTNVVAFEDIGLKSVTPCNVTTSGDIVQITGCQKNHGVLVHFSDRQGSAPRDNIIGGRKMKSYRIECLEISTIYLTVTHIVNVQGTTTEMPTTTTTSTEHPTTTEPMTTTTPTTTTAPTPVPTTQNVLVRKPPVSLLQQLLNSGPLGMKMKERIAQTKIILGF